MNLKENFMLQFVENEPKYFDFIRELRNDEEIKKGFIEQKYITEEEHKKYMQKYSGNYYICLDDEVPVGYVGQIDNDIRVAVHRNYQGKGIGTFLLKNLMKLHPKAFAKIKINNTASIKLFKKCGFKEKYVILELE